MTKKLSYIYILILALMALGFFWFITSISKQKIPQKTEEVTTFDYKKLQKLEGLQHPGQSVSISEPGYGREDPFAPY